MACVIKCFQGFTCFGVNKASGKVEKFIIFAQAFINAFNFDTSCITNGVAARLLILAGGGGDFLFVFMAKGGW